MLSLEMELIAVLLLTAVVGILMGRFLCKNGENEERRKRKKVIHAFQTSQYELEISRDRVKEYSFRMSELEDTIARREQKIRSVETKLLASDKQEIQLLNELKILEKYKTKFESLINEFNIQNRELKKLKTEKIVDKKLIEDFKISNNKSDKNISELKQREVELESSVEKLNQKLTKEREEFESVIQEYKKIIRQKDEDYETLEYNKNKIYQELRDEYESLDNEYEEFKLNYNFDNNRLTSLEDENKKIYQTLETIVIERDDLLARLRAVSSVVNAVGIDNKQLLLEK